MSEMLVLGVETATAQTGVAVGNADGVIASFHLVTDRRHAETLAPAIDFVCQQAGIELDRIGVVAVDVDRGCSPVCAWGSPRQRRSRMAAGSR